MSAAPLAGKRIVVTRAASRAGSLSAGLRAAGAEVVEMPATRIEPLDLEPLHDAVRRLANYDWAIFTSRTAVEIFDDALRDVGLDSAALAATKIAAVGAATMAALQERGITVEVSPPRFIAEGLLEALDARDDVRGSHVLYATAEGAREVLPDGLRQLGARVTRIPIYRSVVDGTGAEDVRAALERGQIDLVTFTAGSAVHGFVSAVGAVPARRAPAATIGPVTTRAARDAGIVVVIEARESTIVGLVRAIVDVLGEKGGPFG